jgi:hypothetical protein
MWIGAGYIIENWNSPAYSTRPGEETLRCRVGTFEGRVVSIRNSFVASIAFGGDRLRQLTTCMKCGQGAEESGRHNHGPFGVPLNLWLWILVIND